MHTNNIPISPLLSSELPLPQMNSPTKHIGVGGLRRNGTSKAASYRHSAQSRGDISILQPSPARQEPHLRIEVVSMILVGTTA